MAQNIRNIRDTGFTFMFNDEMYMSQLYNYITDIKVDPSQIRCVKLTDRLTQPRFYNDVAYLTDDNQLLVMIDQQSTPSKSMLFRMMEYYAALVSEFVIKEEDQNKYGTKEMQIPKAELHIVFNGKGSMEANPKLDLGDIQIKGSVTNIHFKNLTCHDRNHPLVAYAKLIELTKELGFTINDAIDQLLIEGYLVEFFGRREIRDMYVEIFSYDQQLRAEGHAEGRAEGRVEGHAEGRAEERSENIEKTIRIMRNVKLNDDVIAQNLKSEFQLSEEELEEYLTK